MKSEQFRVSPDRSIKLKDCPTEPNGTKLSKSEGEALLAANVEKLAEMQSKLWAQNTYALLVVLQGIDASGKDSTIKHVFSGVNPAGCQVRSFKVPSTEELDHDYLWRYVVRLPERGNIGVFNRSYFEEVLVVRVHPQLLERQRIPGKKNEKFWKMRFHELNQFERYLVQNGTEVLKFFLNISKAEQKQRFLKRLDSPDKNWKFSEGDVKERGFWDDYQAAFNDMLSHTSTEEAPWHVIPADQKWFARLAVSTTIVEKLASLGLDYPKLDASQMQGLAAARKLLENER